MIMKKRKDINDNEQIKLIFILGFSFIIFNFILKFFKFDLFFDEIGGLFILLGGYVYFVKEGKYFSKSWDYLKEIKNYIWFACVVFLIFSLIGFVFPYFFEEQILQFIKDLLAKTEGLGAFGLMKFIFENNLLSSFSAMIFGVFLGIAPLITLVANGYVLGFVANRAVGVGGSLVLLRLLPHGIFEIPAVMISIGLGLRLGSFIFKFVKKNGRENLWVWLKNSIRVFLFIIVPLLVIAGIIEGGLIWLFG